jgi:hypothetical protein
MSPLWWLPGAGTGAPWVIRARAWQRTILTGDDPAATLAVSSDVATGLRTLFHPDAFGQASSIEANVSFDTVGDGWAGVFVQASDEGSAFSGLTFMINPARNQVRLAAYANGQVTSAKSLSYDFTLQAKTIYELTLTSAGDGVLRGFLDQINVISMRAVDGWPTEGFAGLLTDGISASFSIVQFTALTPATAASRTINSLLMPYGDGATVDSISLTPFRWHKRRGIPPWQYVSKQPEGPGSLAGANLPNPPRPIPPAVWRGEASANSDQIAVDGRIWFFMRGNARINNKVGTARVGTLYLDTTKFDGMHYVDPNVGTETTKGGKYILSSTVSGSKDDPATNLNSPSTAYVGQGLLLFLGRGSKDNAKPPVTDTVFSRFDTKAGKWVNSVAMPTSWNDDPITTRLRATPEIVSLRDPDTDEFQAVVFGEVGKAGSAFMGTALATNLTSGTPGLVPGSLKTVLQRPDQGSFYGFRVMFDNGIYYMHYNDGPLLGDDWPDRFDLGFAVDPYAGPWALNLDTTQPDSTYFTRGSEFEPDNGAMWQGNMFKHRGHYYLYYENIHAIGDVDDPYANASDPEDGSRVGYATA